MTTFANVLFNCYISDLETCFKLMPTALYRKLDIRQTGFGMEAEVTGKLLRRGFRPYEVPISYKARSREAGKKLTWRDGAEALWILTRQRAVPRPRFIIAGISQTAPRGLESPALALRQPRRGQEHRQAKPDQHRAAAKRALDEIAGHRGD